MFGLLKLLNKIYDVVTAKMFSQVANGLEEDIVMTFDAPSLANGRMMLVLDMKVWMNDEYRVKFRFYEKPMVSQNTVMKNSAWSWRQKKISLAGEVSRRMLNTSPDLVRLGYAEEDVDQFMFKLMVSGYSTCERQVIEYEGKQRYWNIVQKVEEGCRSMYRSASENKLER